MNAYADHLATVATARGLGRGRIYHATLATGETVTVGPNIDATATAPERIFALHGYQRGACRSEFFGQALGAARRLLELREE